MFDNILIHSLICPTETGQTRTAVVLAALGHYANEKFPHLKQVPDHSEPLATKKAQEAELERVLRATTLDYQRLRAQHENKRSVGSRVYKMIADNGVVGTLKKLIERPTEAQWRRCALGGGGFRMAADWIKFYRRFWGQQFDRLDAFLKRTEPKSDPKPRKGKRHARRNA